MESEQELRAELTRLLNRVPPTFPQWYWNRVVAYKRFVETARKLLAKRNATASQLRAAITEYRSFM